jgi:hypothetical protein
MIKTAILPAVLAVALLAGFAPAEAASDAVPMPAAAQSHPALSAASRAQLAAEAGITLEQAEKLDLSQLAALKSARDGDDGAHVGFGPLPHTRL